MAAQPQAATKLVSPQTLEFGFKASVQADGTLSDIRPDSALPEAIQAMIRKRVATWRYKPAQWQGRTITTPIAQIIRANAVPMAQGGLALRVDEVIGSVEFVDPAIQQRRIPVMPPKFPADLLRSRVNAILVYAVLYDEVGKPQQVDLVFPTKLDRDLKRLDAASRDAIARGVSPQTFDGVAISCRAKIPMTFQTAGAGGAFAPLKSPPEVAAAFDRYTDRCPVTVLETSVNGTFL